MSQTKAVHVFDRLAWFWDNSHDVVLAYVVEAAQEDDSIDPALLSDWRVWASIQDLPFTYPRAHDVEATLMLQLLESAGNVNPDWPHRAQLIWLHLRCGVGGWSGVGRTRCRFR